MGDKWWKGVESFISRVDISPEIYMPGTFFY